MTRLPVFVWDEPTPLVTMTARMEQPVCSAGQPAVLALTLHNEGTGSQSLGNNIYENSSFHITITDSVGRVVPRTVTGERLLTPPAGSLASLCLWLVPGETRWYRYDLAQLFEFSRPGSYSVSVSRWLMGPQEMTLTAGPLQVQIIEAVAEADARSNVTS